MTQTGNKFHTPPRNQGQIVEVSYALVNEQVIRRWHDRSDGETKYAVSRALLDDEGDYWNREPRNRRWKAISAAEVEQMIHDEQ